MRDYGQFTPRKPSGVCSIDWENVLFGDEESGSSGGGSSLVNHLIDQAATLTNTALLSNANPVNAAILTNTPIATPSYSVGTSNSAVAWVLAGLAIFGGLAFVVLDKK